MVETMSKAYSVSVGETLADDDSVTFTVQPYGNTVGKVSAIRVQDVGRGLWFNWDDPPRAWDASPSCAPGVNKLYIAFYAINVGQVDGNLTLKLVDDTGATLATNTVSCAVGAGVGIEWTGTMPSRAYSVQCIVTP